MGSLHATLRAAVVTFAVAATAYAALAWFSLGETWLGWLPANCGEYCEASNRCAQAQRVAVHQPLNSWSNAAYLFVGLCARWSRRTPQATLFWLSCAALGVGSFLFHASVTLAFRWLDVAAMYAALVALAVVAASTVIRVRPFSRWIAIAVIADVALAVFKWHLSTTAVMAVLGGIVVVAIVVTLPRAAAGRAYALLSAAALIVGVVARQLDEARVICAPDGVFQGHALWHLLTAAALYWAYRYFESVDEGNGVDEDPGAVHIRPRPTHRG